MIGQVSEEDVLWARGLARRYAGPRSNWRDDLESEAALGVVQAWTAYNGNCPFRQFARHRVKGAMKDWIRLQVGSTRRGRGQPPVGGRSDLAGVAVDRRPGSDDLADIRNELRATLARLLEVLANILPRNAEIAVAHFFCGQTLSSIGRLYGMSEAAVCLVIRDVRAAILNKGSPGALCGSGWRRDARTP